MGLSGVKSSSEWEARRTFFQLSRLPALSFSFNPDLSSIIIFFLLAWSAFRTPPFSVDDKQRLIPVWAVPMASGGRLHNGALVSACWEKMPLCRQLLFVIRDPRWGLQNHPECFVFVSKTVKWLKMSRTVGPVERLQWGAFTLSFLGNVFGSRVKDKRGKSKSEMK